MAIPYVQLMVGLALLLGGGELLVRGMTSIARSLGLSPLLIGLVFVSIGTSAPELLTSVAAALKGSPGIAVGNVVGSNIANILLVLGTVAIICPIATHREAFLRDGPMALGAALVLTGICVFGEIERVAGAILVLSLAAYVFWTYWSEQKRPDAAGELREAEANAVTGVPRRIPMGIGLSVAGFAALTLGADTMVGGAITLARAWGMSESAIGLSVIAVGTSLPELAASTIAALRRQADLAFGSVIGSNIFNVFGILGTAALVRPMTVPQDIAAFDLAAMLGATLILVLFAVTGWRLNRWEGGVFLAAYATYLYSLVEPGSRAALGFS